MTIDNNFQRSHLFEIEYEIISPNVSICDQMGVLQINLLTTLELLWKCNNGFYKYS